MYALCAADAASIQVASGLQTKPPGSDTVRAKNINTSSTEQQESRKPGCQSIIVFVRVSWVVYQCSQWSGIQLSTMMTESNGITANADL